MELNEQKGGPLPKQVCLLVYDRECKLCVSTKEKLEQLGVGEAGADVRFLAYQSEEAMKALGQNYHPGRPIMAFLIRPSGEVLQGLDAFLPFASNFPGGKFLLWWLRFPFTKRLAEWGYRVIAHHRYRWFGGANSVGQQV